MPKILMVFFSSLKDRNGNPAIPCFYDAFIQGMSQEGNAILAIRHDMFNIDFGALDNAALESVIRDFDPDAAFLFNNSFYDLSGKFDFPIIIYDVDSPRYFANKDIIKSNPGRYKFVTSQLSSVGTLTSQFSVRKNDILHVPFFTSIHNEPAYKKHNICFIGTRFPVRDSYGLSPWNRFMATNPGLKEKQLFRDMIDGIQKYPRMEQEIIAAFIKRGLRTDFSTTNNELLHILSGAKRELILSQVSDLGLVVHGKDEWVLDSTADMDLALAYDRTPVATLKENQDVYNSSKIGININHTQADSGFSWRVLDIMASGACLVTEENKRLKELFPNLDIPMFKDRFEARDICRKILADESLRLEIVSQCNAAVEKGFRFNDMAVALENFLGMNFHNGGGDEAPAPVIVHVRRERLQDS